MKSRSLARAGRTAWLAALLLALVASASLAVEPPPPPPPVTVPPIVLPDTLLYIRDITVGRRDCETCPPIACPGEPVPVMVRGQFPSGCYVFRGLHLAPNRGLFPVLVADIVVDTCDRACSLAPVPFTGSAELPASGPGSFTFALQEQFRRCPDTTSVSLIAGRGVPYEVQQQCASPPPPADSLVRTFVSLRIVPERPCAGDTVTLQLVKNGCPPCVHLVSFGNGASGNFTFEGVIDWTPLCMDFACIPETLSAPMGRLSQGSFAVSAPMTVRVLGTENPDSTIRFRLPFEFQVGPPCSNPPPSCVQREMFSIYPPGQCAVTLAPGAAGDVPLLYQSEVAMAAVEGMIDVPYPFQLTDLRLASHLTGVHLSRQRHPGGMRWLVFCDPGVTLAPGARQHLLNVTVTADPTAPDGASVLMAAAITLASDPDGNELPLCLRQTLDVIATRLCVAGDASVCDVNHDGRLDVRDLVHMVHCLGLATPADVDTGSCVDCDSSGVFDLNDVFCCAKDILRGPFVPRDSVRNDAAVSVTFDPIEALGSGDLLVRVRVHGARALGAAMLRFDYPGTSWRASLPVRVQTGPQPVDVDWYPIIDVSRPGRIDVGGLRLGDTGAAEFVFDVVMTPLVIPLHQPTPQGRLDAVAADLAARDGSVMTPMGALPSVVLEPGATPDGSALALSPARPNPFNGSTTFSVRLPASAPVDLAVHDLAGRRIATLAHAVYGPGEHSFSWDGTGARDGLYFVRLTVNGQVLSTRVAMLRDSR